MPPFGKAVLALPAIAAIVLVPWTVGLAIFLPHRAIVYHWNTAWTGLDIVIAMGLALTSWLSLRHNARAALTAAVTVTLMCTDAWFDLCTSAPGQSFAYAAAEATAELMVAAACLAIGVRTRRDANASMLRDLPGSGDGADGRRTVALAAPGQVSAVKRPARAPDRHDP